MANIEEVKIEEDSSVDKNNEAFKVEEIKVETLDNKGHDSEEYDSEEYDSEEYDSEEYDSKEDDNNELYFEDVMKRCEEWMFGDVADPKELDIILQRVYAAGDKEDLKPLCKAVLRHDYLPALYKAKCYAYLSTCTNAKGAAELLFQATMCLNSVRSHCWRTMSWKIPEEISQWGDAISTEKTKVGKVLENERREKLEAENARDQALKEVMGNELVGGR